jgi:hypothetical protein
MRRARALAFATLAGLAACSEFAPFETYAPPAPKGASEPGPRVAVCYDRLVSKPPAIAAAAQAQCPPGATATPLATDFSMQNCPLLLPSRAIFVCTPRK